jgi:predicted enzyme related to lactoylglutathione lyase
MKLLGIDNIFIQVKDLEHAANFYEKLGCVHKMNIPQIPASLFSIGNEEPGIILCKATEPKPSKLWIEVEDAKQAQIECNKIGIVGRFLEHGTGFAFEITDADGNIIGFTDYSKKPELARKVEKQWS